MCCWLSGVSELVTVVIHSEGEWFMKLDGRVCWWLNGGSELGVLNRQAEGELDQGVRWLCVLVAEWWI